MLVHIFADRHCAIEEEARNRASEVCLLAALGASLDCVACFLACSGTESGCIGLLVISVRRSVGRVSSLINGGANPATWTSGNVNQVLEQAVRRVGALWSCKDD